jgi:hypothetical protein
MDLVEDIIGSKKKQQGFLDYRLTQDENLSKFDKKKKVARSRIELGRALPWLLSCG